MSLMQHREPVRSRRCAHRIAALFAMLVVVPLEGCKSTSGSGEPATYVLPGFVAVKQEEPVWCWAACAEMILRFHGIETKQSEIAKRIDGVDSEGVLKVEAASRFEILCALNPDMPRGEFEALWSGVEQSVLDSDAWLEEKWNRTVTFDRSRAVNAAFDKLAPRDSPIVEDLLAGHPAVVGLRESEDAPSGHAYVLFGAKYAPRARSSWRLPAGLGDVMVSEATASLLGPETSPDVLRRFRDLQTECERFGIKSVDQFIQTSAYQIHEVELVDPWEGETITLSIEEFVPRVDFVITRSYARQVLENWQEIARVESD